VVAGEGVIMVEAGANQLPEQDIIEAIDFGYEAVRELIQAQKELIAELGIELVQETPPEVDTTLLNFIRDRGILLNKSCLNLNKTKKSRDAALDAVKESIVAESPSQKKTRPSCQYRKQKSGWQHFQTTKELTSDHRGQRSG